MIGEEIYDIFKRELDGEEFETDDDAIAAMNVAYRKILALRNWEALKRTTTLSAGSLSLSSISDNLDRVLEVWATMGVDRDEQPLDKATFSDRFNYDKDYYYDHINIKTSNDAVIFFGADPFSICLFMFVDRPLKRCTHI